MTIKLTDIVAVMKSKWTYGDKFFGYTEEFNDNHKTQYPSLLVTPPDSVFPEVGLNNGWENYTFEVYFSDLYNRTAQANESIEQRWENLQDLSTEWLDNFLKYYQADAPITAFLEDESVVIERNKEVANDQLIQIKMTFTWRVLSKCFRPQSTYPNQLPNLSSWLRADSNVTFSIPTKKVSAVGDSSGNNNGYSQGTKLYQPLRYTYGGLLDKTIFTYKSSNEEKFISDNLFKTSGSTQQAFTIFVVCKIDAVSQSVFGYYDLASGGHIEMGLSATGHYTTSISDGTTTLTGAAGENSIGKYFIGGLRKHNRSLWLNYNSATSSSFLSDYEGAFNLGLNFSNVDKFRIGCGRESDGLTPPATINTRFMDGNLHEVIIYDRKLDDYDYGKIQDYLNKKYKIY
jgi:hypothetical protein